MNLEINATKTFDKNYVALFNDTKRFIINQGSSRSGKTWGLCQLMIVYALTNPNKTISIVRKTFPTLRATVMRDFFEVMREMDLYNRANHNKTEHIYQFDNGTIIEFFSTDDEQKLRGRKRDICWANEANELIYDDFLQLNMRTTDRIIVDYNPSDSDSWIYNLDASDSILIKSTYKDNPFLSKAIVKQIEALKDTDEALYQIYALGERATSRKNVYTNWEFIDEKPERFTEYVLGVDFGYNHPTAISRVWFYESEIYIEGLLYESYLTTPELIEKMSELGIDKNADMVCDYARPEIIQDLKNEGYNAKLANKAVKEGINNVKSFKIYCQNNNDLKKEYQNYMWKKVGDRILDDVVKQWDDYMDSIRYAVTEIKTNHQYGNQLISF
jgi:phage terminase large subunit